MQFIRLKALSEGKNMTQQQVGNYLHCQREVYRRYETSEREIPVWALLMLADLNNVSADYILGRTKCRNPYPPK